MTSADNGHGWTLIDGLADPDVRAADAEPGRPRISVAANRVDRATVVRLAFRAGDVMDDHQAAAPILIVGMSGELLVTVGDDAVRLTPGRMVHVAERVRHRLEAPCPASAALIVLTGR